jgi:hypothetical protein
LCLACGAVAPPDGGGKNYKGAGMFSASPPGGTSLTAKLQNDPLNGAGETLTIDTGGGVPRITNGVKETNPSTDPVWRDASLYTARPTNEIDQAYVFSSLQTSTGKVDLTDSHVGFLSTSLLDPVTKAPIGGDAGWYAAGNPTTDMPTGVKATYQGGFVGQADDGKGNTGTARGDLRMNVDFGAATYTGGINNIQISTGGGPLTPSDMVIGMNGAITGNTYTGTATLSAPSSTDTFSTTSSVVTGGFYGPAAAETAGTVNAQGTRTTVVAGGGGGGVPGLPGGGGGGGGIPIATNVFVGGAFAGKKQ